MGLNIGASAQVPQASPAQAAAQAPAGASWLKTGSDSAQLAKQEAVNVEVRKSEQGKMFRFFMDKGEDARVTFVDGSLGADGTLMPPRFYEHTIQISGKWTNYVCPEQTNPASKDKCPICESGDRPALVAVFTVIDHRTFKSTKTQGKEYSNTPKLFVAKSGTFELLNKLAMKRGGLVGTTWDVMRTGDKAPAVGSAFDYIGKEELDVLKQKYIHEVVDPKANTKTVKTYFEPANYESEIVFRDGNQLRQMGLCAPGAQVASGFGGGQSMGTGQQAATGQSYAEQL